MIESAGISMTRLTLDVTETLATAKWTGIERVVRRLSTELMAGGNDFPPIRLVAAVGGRFHELNAAGFDRLLSSKSELRNMAQSSRDGLLRQLAVRFLSWTPPIFLWVQANQKERHFAPLLRPFLESAPADFRSGDVILLLDSYWAGTSAVPAARAARSAGARVVSAIYDLIPITHPVYMTPLLAIAFPRRLLEALKISDAAIAISRNSATELRKWLRSRLPNLPISWFPLGNDPTASARNVRTGPVKNYTMIGTVEPRKGHDLVLDAFQQRWSTGCGCQLTIVGRLGWISQRTRARLNALKNEPRLKLVHDADDERLATILAETDAVIMASRAEGFGLPIVESLALDIPVIASDIEIFREIGGDAIIAFDPYDSLALISSMEELEACPELYRAQASSFTWLTWRQAAQQLVAALDRTLHSPNATEKPSISLTP